MSAGSCNKFIYTADGSILNHLSDASSSEWSNLLESPIDSWCFIFPITSQRWRSFYAAMLLKVPHLLLRMRHRPEMIWLRATQILHITGEQLNLQIISLWGKEARVAVALSAFLAVCDSVLLQYVNHSPDHAQPFIPPLVPWSARQHLLLSRFSKINVGGVILW